MPEHILTTKGMMPKPETLAGASIPEYIEVKTATGNTVAFLSPESDGVEAWIDDEQNGSCTLEIELPIGGSSKPVNVLHFDGVDDYVDIGSSLQSTSQMTIEGKIKLDDYSTERNIISNNLGAGTAQYTMRIGTNGKLTAGISTTSKGFWVADVCDIEKNTEIHLASVINSTNNTYAVYKNGNIVASGTLTDGSYSLGTGKTFIGKDNRNACYFDGIIDDVRIWNTARTQQQIQDNMNKELTGNETGLVGYWKLNEGTGTTANDSTANGNNGTIYGATWVNTNQNKLQYLTDKYRIYADGKEFVILNPDAVDKQRDGKKLTGKIKAHESWVLLGKKYQTISNDPQNPSPPWGAVIIVSGGAAHGGFDPGSAGSALSYLLQGTGWTVGTVDVTGTYDLETEKESVLYNINQVQEKWGGILVWDSINHTVSLRDEETWQNYTGYQIRYAKNLKGITRTDDYDIVTRLYPFGENDLNIANVNGGLLYLDNHSYSDDILEGVWYNQDLVDQTQLKAQGEKQLAVMCRPRHNYKTEVLDLRSLPGYGHETFARSDMVDLLDEDFGANARVRIIRYRHNVFQPWLCDMELGDPLEKIAASVAQTVLMAKFYKNVVKPNESFQNLLKAIINTAATEINGASGDYTLVDGVSTWFDRDSETGELTGKLLRITPQGLIISHDGGQTWKLAISGEGIHAEAGWVGKLNAGVVTIGADTTFEPGYDPVDNHLYFEYSVDGMNWHPIFNSASDLYMRQKVGDNGTWSEPARIAAVDGVDGVDGQDGTSIVWKGEFTSHPISPQNGWAYRNTADGKSYVYQDGTWYQMTIDGVDGQDGYTPIKGVDYFDGVDGQDGRDGQDGTSAYLWVRYSQNADGNPMTTDPTGAVYIGIATTTTPTAPTSHTAYQWSLIKGQDGVPGEKGADGRTSYLHIKYADENYGDISTGKESGMSASSMYSSAYSPDNLVDGSIVFGPGTAFASASGATFPQWHQIDLGDTFSINKVRWINNRHTANLPKDYTIAISETGAFAGEQAVVATVTGNTTYNTWVEHIFAPVKGRYVRMTVSAVVAVVWGTYYELAEWQIYGTYLDFTANDGETPGAYIGTYVDFNPVDSTDFNAYTWNKVKGTSIVWKGELASPPSNPEENWVYRDTDNGYVYIYNGTAWELMVTDGADGIDGAPGADGMSVYITYHNNPTDSPPATPTGDGTSGGWYTAPSAQANWMSQKVATNAYSGTWGAPILISGGRKFTSQPVPPYDVGDLWIGGSDGQNTLICTTARSSGSFVASDWERMTEPVANMGVDSDCLGLWHFDGSLNSHKGVAAIGNEDFGTGCFGQAVKVEEGTINLLSLNQSSVEIDLTGFTASNMNISRDNAHAKHGSYALKAAWTGIAGDAYFVPYGITLNPNTTYSWQAWVYSESDIYLPLSNCYIMEFGGNWRGTGVAGTGLTKIPAGIWTKIGGTGSTHSDWISGANSAILLRPPCDSVGNTLTTPIWVDCLQLEQKAYTTSWQIGACIPPMTADNIPAPYAVSTSFDQLPGQSAYAAFDGTPDTDIWSHSTLGVTTGQFNIDLGSAQIVNRYEMRCQWGYASRAPKNWTFEGSNDNTNWTVLHSVTDYSAWQQGISSFWDFHNETAYRYYRINVTANNGDSYLSLSKIQVYCQRQSGMRVSTDDLSPSQGTISLRAKNLSASANGSVLIDLPKSDNTQGLQVGIANDGKICLTDDTTTVYGLSKSTLTAWDSISLAWKPDRLSLVVNDSEACYIENPGLPTAFGSYLFISTDRNGANAINTLVDELRIDKVYRDASIRTGWHKTGVPFYTSEDMKQWPGYVKVETDGLKVYDSSDDLRVLVGSWVEDAIRKYGIRIIDGLIEASKIYGTSFQSGQKGATSYVRIGAGFDPLEIKENGKTALNIWSYGGGMMQFYNTLLDSMMGQISVFNDASGTGLKVHARNNAGSDRKLMLVGSDIAFDASGHTSVESDLWVTGTLYSGGKSNIEVTENYGIRTLVVRESPDHKYIVEGIGEIINGTCRIDIEPIFLECIEPNSVARWVFQLTPHARADLWISEIADTYFVVSSDIEQLDFSWTMSAYRKNYADIYLPEYVSKGVR